MAPEVIGPASAPTAAELETLDLDALGMETLELPCDETLELPVSSLVRPPNAGPALGKGKGNEDAGGSKGEGKDDTGGAKGKGKEDTGGTKGKGKGKGKGKDGPAPPPVVTETGSEPSKSSVPATESSFKAAEKPADPEPEPEPAIEVSFQEDEGKPSAKSIVDELQSLGRLKVAGALSEREFETAKAKVRLGLS